MKIAIVTGATSGMGKEMVYHLADRISGLSEIWVVGRRKEILESFIGNVPVRIRTFALDLTKKSDLAVLQTALIERHPDVRILVNAAGVGNTGKVGEISQDQTRNMIRLNMEALSMVTEMVLPYLSTGSRVIQFSSAAAFVPQPGFAVYAATKSYVLSYSRALAAELRQQGIFVTAVCPGTVHTEFLDLALNGKKLPKYKQMIMADPRKVVKTAVDDSLKGKGVSVAGLPMQVFQLICKLVPHEWIMKMISW